MGDGYYYTLSAIAQSFAAIVGLNAIFVVYILQLLRNHRAELFNKIRQLKRMVMVEGRRRYPVQVELIEDEINRLSEESLLAWADSTKEAKGDIRKLAKNVLKEIENRKGFSNQIFYWLKITLLLNGFTIVLSLVLLPWKQLFPNCLQYALLLIVLLLSIFALFVTIHAILVTIELGGLSIINKIFRQNSLP